MGRKQLPPNIFLPAPTTPRERTVNQAILDIYLLLRQSVSNVAIITFGLAADIPASTGSGALYWATDTDTLYVDEP